jgi:uncharacterized protein (UPF0548 family)
MFARPDEPHLEEMLRRCSNLDLSYEYVGATARGGQVPGYRQERRAVAVGVGSASWASAREAVEQWRAHQGAGARLTPAQPRLVAGSTLLVSIRIGPLTVVAPCRIVYVTDESDRFGFAYGTLPGHPERGEESFHVRREADGRVLFEITAFSRPADALARLGAPLARALQVRTTRRYLDGVRSYVVATA